MAADWDDVEAAALVAVDAIDSVVVTSTREGVDQLVFELKTVRNEEGRLVATRLPDQGTDRLSLEAAIGRFGDADRERRLLEAMTSRLTRLYGVEFAPR